MSVSDRYTSSSPSTGNKICPSCGAENQPYLVHHGDNIECPKCFVKEPQPGLGELTDKYIREGLTDEDAFRQAKEDRY
ncbi:hypothetical protein LCGC14_1606250 [marine sediment metagenome]|uniref:Uncharacterized protein n=1 Tax=marine sediment metagenome TaxID=412755 RepID=A0A0F9L9L4_9ZZZZ